MAREKDQRYEEALPPELLILLQAFRNEIDARFKNVYLYAGALFIGGGTIGGIISRLLAPQQTNAALGVIVHIFTS